MLLRQCLLVRLTVEVTHSVAAFSNQCCVCCLGARFGCADLRKAVTVMLASASIGPTAASGAEKASRPTTTRLLEAKMSAIVTRLFK